MLHTAANFSLISCLQPPVVSLLFHLVEQLVIVFWLVSERTVSVTGVSSAVVTAKLLFPASSSHTTHASEAANHYYVIATCTYKVCALRFSQNRSIRSSLNKSIGTVV